MGLTTHQIARESLALLADSFRLFPLPDVDRPEPEEYGTFLLEHPQYAPSYHMTAQVFTESRDVSAGMPQHMQELAGALIRVTFDNEQLVELANTTN